MITDIKNISSRQLRYNLAGIDDIFIKSTLGVQALIFRNLDGSIDNIDINYEDDVESIVNKIISIRTIFNRKEKLKKINESRGH